MTTEEPESPAGGDDSTSDGVSTGSDSIGDADNTEDWHPAGQAVADGGAEPAPEEMTLEELRQEIQDIDREIVDRIARRTYVAETIAEVKAERGLPTTDESQEAAVMERAGENAEQFDLDANLVKAIFRLLIELNKVTQRKNR